MSQVTENRVDHRVRHVETTECWALLTSADIGRVAVIVEGSVEIFPVNYLVKDEAIFFSSAPGSKLIEITNHPEVTFEADGLSNGWRWSVVAKGLASRVMFDTDIEDSGVQALHSLTPSEKFNYVRISDSSLTGRLFRSSRRPRESVPATA
jgi:uncharacterized protein